MYTAQEITSVLSITIIAIIALMILKASRNVMAPPFVLATDHSKDYFDIPTMYKKSVSLVHFFLFSNVNVIRNYEKYDFYFITFMHFLHLFATSYFLKIL